MNFIFQFGRNIYVSLWGNTCQKRILHFDKLLSKYSTFPRYTITLLKYKKYELEVLDVLSVMWQIKDYFVLESYKFKCNTTSPIIYDCGANVGIASLYFLELYPNSKIKAFEADLEIASTYKKNIEKNASNSSVEIIPKAVWVDSNGIFWGRDGADSGSIYKKNNRIKIESIRLKDLISNERRIDLLKMDIEGAEIDVIMDCQSVLNKIKYFFFEYHVFPDRNHELDVLLKILVENKFQYFIRQISDQEKPFINYCDKSSYHINIFAINEQLD